MLKNWIILLAMLVSPGVANAFDHDHQAFSQLLGDVVVVKDHQSRVDYKQLIQRRAELDRYLEQLSAVPRATFDQFTGSEQLAFLINTYNAYQLKQVIDHYPIESIKDVGSFFSSPWSKEFFSLFGKPASLDHVEHGLIRELFDEPRIHFAVNCASISCPPLAAEAYRGGALDTQLEAATENFLADTDANYRKGQRVLVSKIFDWYEEDFNNGVLEFVGKYMPDVPQGKASLDDLSIGYTPYNWNLNALATAD